jgi:hypothetical protein
MIQIPGAYLLHVTTGITDGVLNCWSLKHGSLSSYTICNASIILYGIGPGACIVYFYDFTVVINCEL